MKGEYTGNVCEGEVDWSYGIAISEDSSVFMTDMRSHRVFKFKLINLQLVTEVGKE